MHQFDEHHAELKGFSSYFHEEIFPFLGMQVSNRQDVINEFKLHAIPITFFVLAAAIYIGIHEQSFDLPIFSCVIGAIILGAYFQYKIKNVKANIKNLIVEGICSYLGWAYFAEVTNEPNLNTLSDYYLIPHGFERTSFEDQMTGQVHGIEFQSVEIRLESKVDERWITKFRGQVMTFTFHRKFLGQTVVLRDKGVFQRKERGDMKRVGLVDPVFEKIFEAYSTDQVESRYLLDPVVMQKMVDLERILDGKNIRFGFVAGQLLIVVQTPNRFEGGSMLKSMTAQERTQKTLDEIGIVYDIVDAILVSEPS